MLVDLVPEFFPLRTAEDPLAAYRAYVAAHRPVLEAYWRNYLLDPDDPHAAPIILQALAADRTDLTDLLARLEPRRLMEEAVERARVVLHADHPIDSYLMVGLGGANAGELVLGGRGTIFICLEHFTGRANPETYGLGLDPSLIPLWVGHEVAHTVRYTSPASASELRRLVAENGGYYDYWDTGSRATLRELLLNEGLAVHAARAVAPGFAIEDYFGYRRRQYTRLREMETFLRDAVAPLLDETGLGLRLRYLSGGTSPETRRLLGRVMPERAGYYLGYRMAEALVAEIGIAEALRAPAEAFQDAEERGRQIA